MNWRQRSLEIVITTALLAGLCWSPPPDVNESHYLAKAKHFWLENWCGEDLFLNSFDTHWVSFALLGSTSLVFELPAVAWVGRIVCWTLLAAGFVRLALVWTARPWTGCWIGPAIVLVNRYGHWSGEWFCGGAEGKSIAYGCVFFALSYVLENRWRWAWGFLGMACAMHILVGGWAMTAFFAAALTLRLRPVFAKQQGDDSFPAAGRVEIFPGLFIGLLLALPGLIPALLQNWNVDASVAIQAAQVQVSGRLAHHLNAFEFQSERHISFMITLIVFGIIAWRSRANRDYQLVGLIAVYSLALAAVGLLLSAQHRADQASPLVVRSLTLYWFRVADVLVPTAIVLGLFSMGQQSLTRLFRPWLTEIAALLIALGVIANATQNVWDPRPRASQQSQMSINDGRRRAIETHRNWKEVCRWIRLNTPADAIFITPQAQQTFKWYAHRGEVANWKDMPQDAESIVEWIDRLEQLYMRVPAEPYGLLSFLDSELIELGQRYSADYLLVWQRHEDQRILLGDPVSLERVYPSNASQKSTFVIFRFP